MASSDVKYAAKKTTPAPLKLRNSCEACANSKVKCSQDKPRCTRCTKKQLNCDYVMARRGGRKPNSIVRAMAEGVSDRSARGGGSFHRAGQYEGHNYTKSSSGTSTSSNSPGPVSAQVWTSAAGADTSLFTPGYSMPCLDSAFNSTFTDTENDLEELMGLLPAKRTTVHPSTWEGFEESHISSAPAKDGTPALDSNATLDVSTLLDLLCGTDVNITNTRSCSSHVIPVANMWNRDEVDCISPCNCLDRSTLLMQKLSRDPLCERLSREGSVSVDQIRAMLDGNEDIADALGVVLECSCDKDGYLLSVLSLMIFKILDRSAVLARKKSCSEGREMEPSGADKRQHHWPPSSRQSSTSSSLLEIYCLEGRDFPRMITQLVLSKLHRVGRLADQLSNQLQTAASRKRNSVGTGFRGEQDVAASLMCTQLGLDIRKRLNALSRELVQRLRSL